MTDPHWQRVSELLSRALETTPTHRASLLARLSEEDPTVCSEIEDLLGHGEAAPEFLSEPAVWLGSEVGPSLEPGSTLGAYRIIRRLDRGGMGDVYLAAREGDFQRTVALKVHRDRLRSATARHRFENERQILAQLDHPNIARLFDGGTCDDGRPFLVLEYVPGTSIDRTGGVGERSVSATLDLFLQVCAAVSALHRHEIVHRDLKPSNVLVTADGQVKLLDFGIAKALRPSPELHGSLTRLGPSPLTLHYASPEQVRGTLVTTSTDVYSLGVLLCRLLTGGLPYRGASDRVDEIVRAICDDPPLRPSEVAARRASGGAGGRFDRRRRSRALAGDLDSIVLRALHKDPANRYSSVDAFAEDLRRHRAGLPIEAREATVVYRARKLIRRQWLGLSVGAMVGALMVMVLVTRQQAAVDRAGAVGQHHRAETVGTFLESLVGSATREISRGDRSPRSWLDRVSKELLESLDETPLEQADLTSVLAQMYREIGAYPESASLFGIAVARLQDYYGMVDHPKIAKDLNNLAGVYYRMGRSGEAISNFRLALAMGRRLGQPEIELVAMVNNLASCLSRLGRFEEAERLYADGLAERQAHFGPRSKQVANSLYALGVVSFLRGQLDEADERLSRALRLRIEHYGTSHKKVATTLVTLGRVASSAGRDVDGESYLRRALEMRLDLLGEEHVHVARTRIDLAEVLLERGRDHEAKALLDVSVPVLLDYEPPNESWIAAAEGALGAWYLARHDLASAEPLLVRSLSAFRRTGSPRSIYARRASDRVERLREMQDPRALLADSGRLEAPYGVGHRSRSAPAR